MRGFLSKFGAGGPGKDANTLLNKVIQVSSFTLRCEELVGAGGYASIYRVVDQGTSHEYALKHLRLPPDSDAVAEVRQEMKIMYQLGNHPNVLKLHAASFAGPPGKETDAFMVMDFCRVTLLDEMQRCNFQLDNFFVYEVFSEVCQGVAHMHLFSPPYAHRDIKAENVLKTDRGKWVLCDFGSATTKAQVYESPAERAMEEEVIRRTTTPAYRAPEMWDLVGRQRIDTKVDIWALGVLLYVLVFGKLPFQGDSKLSILFGKYDMPQGKPAAFCDLIREMLTTDPALRPDILTVLSRLDSVKQSLYNSIGATVLPTPPAAHPLPHSAPHTPLPLPQPQPLPNQPLQHQQHQQHQRVHPGARPTPSPGVQPQVVAPVHANGLSRVSAPLGQPSSPYGAAPPPVGRAAGGVQPPVHGAPMGGTPGVHPHPHMQPHHAAAHVPGQVPSPVHPQAPRGPGGGVHSHPVALMPAQAPAGSAGSTAQAAGAPMPQQHQPQHAAQAPHQPPQAPLTAQQQFAAGVGSKSSLKRSMQIQPPSQALAAGPVTVRGAADVATRLASATPLFVPQQGALQLPGGGAAPTTPGAGGPPAGPAAPQEPPTATLIEVDAGQESLLDQQQSLLGEVGSTPTKKGGPDGKAGHRHKRSSSFSETGFGKDAFTLSSQQQHLFEPDWGDKPAFVGGQQHSAAVPGKPGHGHSASASTGHHSVPQPRTSHAGLAAVAQRLSDSGAAAGTSSSNSTHNTALAPQTSSSSFSAPAPAPAAAVAPAAAPAAASAAAANAARPGAGAHKRSASRGQQEGLTELSSQPLSPLQLQGSNSTSGAATAGPSHLASAGVSGGAGGGSYELEALRVQVKGLLATHQSLAFRVKQLEDTVVEQAELIKTLQKALGLGLSVQTQAQQAAPAVASERLPGATTSTVEGQSPLHPQTTTPVAASASVSASGAADGVADERQAPGSPTEWHPFSPKDAQ